MKYLAPALVCAAIAAPALAHEEGAHMHPHGGENLLALLIIGALAVFAAVRFLRR